MAEATAIEWCDSTFNPWIGCTRVGPGCDHCYAERRMDTRLHLVRWGAGQQRLRTSPANWREPVKWNRSAAEFIAEHGRRQRVFCASLADVFDNEVPSAWRTDLFALIADTPHLDWLLVTKRIGNVASMLGDHRAAPLLPNIWLGITVVNQAEYERDVPKLLRVPATVRFLSVEPMLGPIDLGLRCENWSDDIVMDPETGARECCKACDYSGIGNAIDWVICGGETGPNARPMHPNWARGLRDQCIAADVPFLFKQWGEWSPRGPESLGYPLVDGVPTFRLTDAGQAGQRLGSSGGNDCWMQRSGKAKAGRQLDGVTNNGFPGGRPRESTTTLEHTCAQ